MLEGRLPSCMHKVPPLYEAMTHVLQAPPYAYCHNDGSRRGIGGQARNERTAGSLKCTSLQVMIDFRENVYAAATTPRDIDV